MAQSENINELIAALSKAQGEMEPAKFNKKGQRHRYADFTSVINSCRAPLCNNNLAITQYVETVDNKYVLVSMLTHTSGQWITSHLPLLMQELTCQALGSAMTYMKRYGLSALLGIVSDEDDGADDDGEEAMTKAQPPKPAPIEKMEPIGLADSTHLAHLIGKLDEKSKNSFKEWIEKEYGSFAVEFLPKHALQKCINRLNATIKYLKDQEKTEVAQ